MRYAVDKTIQEVVNAVIDKLARCVAHFVFANEETHKFDEDAYFYGFSVFLSTITNVAFVLIAGLIMGCFFESMLFMGAFVLLRIKAGGYHAKTHGRCIALFTVTFIFSAVILLYILEPYYLLCIFGCGGLGAIAIWEYAPAAAANKPVNHRKKEKLRDQCVIIATVFMAFAVIVYYIPFLQSSLFAFMFAGYGSAAISLIAAGKKSKGGRKNVEKAGV